MHKSQKDSTLLKIFFVIVLIGAVAICAVWLAPDFLSSHAIQNISTDSQDALAKAQEMYSQGAFAEARELLLPVVAKAKTDSSGLQAVMLLAKVDQHTGNTAGAMGLLERAYREFSENRDHARAAIAYSRALEDAGNVDQCVKVYQEVRDTAPAGLRAAAITGLGRHAEKENDLLVARELYRQAVLDAVWDSDEWSEALDALGQINVAMIFSPAQTPESKRYTIQKGDSITGIGNTLNTTQGLLTRANGIDETTKLNLGQQIKYTPKDFGIVIERSKCRLFLVDKDGIFKRYSVGMGKPGRETTLGSYKIGNKEKNPTWHKPGEGPIPFGDPRNELGTRWMPLVPDQEGLPKDLGIHGTIHPDTIGQYSSNGCIRLNLVDIEELYDLVVRATPVEIVETFAGPEAKDAGQPPADPPGQQ